MFSPGQDHKLVPKPLDQNLAWRIKLLQACESDPRLQRAFEEICRRDILFWINAFVWQFNPNKIEHEVEPFVTWAFQDEAFLTILDCVERRDDLRIVKSREMGASWMCLLVMAWFLIFQPNKKFPCISRSEAAVDKAGDADSLFWKVDFILEHMPDWLVKDRIQRLKMSFRNKVNRSQITGEASTGRAGVGGRGTAMFVDEFSQIDEAYEVLQRTADTTKCRIFNFTFTGTDNAAYDLSLRPDMRELRLHWSEHPEKNKGLYRFHPETNKIEYLDPLYEYPPDYRFVMDGSPSGGPFPGLRSPWYDAECIRRRDARAIAMDLDINPSGSMSQFFDPLMIRQLILQTARPPLWEGDVLYDKETGAFHGIEPRKGGPLRLWVHPMSTQFMAPDEYVIGGDLSAGTGATNSCFSMVSATTGQKVGEYITPFVSQVNMAPIAVALCWMFRWPGENMGAYLGWELNGGTAFGRKVLELGYRHIFYRVDELKLSPRNTDTPGWSNNPTTKRTLLEEYRASLYKREFSNPSEEALEECLQFRYGKGGTVEHSRQSGGNDPSGAGENHADRVIGDALADKLRRKLGFKMKAAEKQLPEVPVLSLQWRRDLHDREKRRREAWA